MGLLSDFARGVSSITGNTRLDRLCRELGWPIDERKGDGIALYFGTGSSTRRAVIVIHPSNDSLMFFICKCGAEFSSHNLPDDLLPAMLARNDDVTIGGWAAEIEGRKVLLRLKYTALAAGVDAATFKRVCELMINEVATIEEKLAQKGLL